MLKSNVYVELCPQCNVYHDYFYNICCLCKKQSGILWSKSTSNTPFKCYNCILNEGGAFNKNGNVCVTRDNKTKTFIGLDGHFYEKIVTYSFVYYVFYNYGYSNVISPPGISNIINVNSKCKKKSKFSRQDFRY